MNQREGMVGQRSPAIQDDMLRRFDPDDADWYIMQCAFDAGLDPHKTVRSVRTAQAKGVSTGAVPIVAPAAAAGPAPALPAPAFGWPPGIAGEVARFVYQAAPRPVPEVAVAASLGLLAGICGRRWVAPGSSGLNLYIMLVARSAIGKEAMHKGIGTLVRAMCMKLPTAGNHVAFDNFASGPALLKFVATNPCFVNVVGEFGKKFEKMASDKEGPHSTLRTELTNLYQKSGPGSVAGGIAYSNKDNNARVSTDVAYSLLGETTPGTFFESITPSTMSDGFMSRFTVIEYDGERPPRNMHQVSTPSDALINSLVSLAGLALDWDSRNIYELVGLTQDAQRAYDAFEDRCDDKIKEAGADESRRQVWNRAALKVLRSACLLAAADNPTHPRVTTEHFGWAIGLVERDIALFLNRLDSGDIGTDDHAREQKVLDVCRRFLTQEKVAERYEKSFESMRLNSIVPRAYLQTMTQKLAQFGGHKFGATSALDLTLRSLIAASNLMEVDKSKVGEGYNYHGTVYRVLRFDFSKQGEESKAAIRTAMSFWKD
ncbi:MAG: DUF3987 domain-containing protein [Brachymonas sp.]|nr:DUF3987 domain-containing protein [Brachymonas sp.]